MLPGDQCHLHQRLPLTQGTPVLAKAQRPPESPIQVSLSLFNYEWPTYEVHPAMMEGVAARLLGRQCGLTGWNEARQLVDSPNPAMTSFLPVHH